MNKLATFLRITLLAACGAALADDTPDSTDLNPQQPKNLCIADGHKVLFFNGVQNTPEQAQASTVWIGFRTGERAPDGEPVSVELMYNETDGLNDFREVFHQRAIEHEVQLDDEMDVLWNILTNGDPEFFETMSAYADFFQAVRDDITSSVIGTMSNADTNQTQTDYAEHNGRIDALILEGYKLTFVAHSQGNLFMNKGLQRVPSDVTAGALHVAPASSVLNGPHVLADLDLVINGLRASGSVPPNNVEIPAPWDRPDPTDWKGHGLIEIYLNAAMPNPTGGTNPNLMFISNIKQQMNRATRRQDAANKGFFTVTLTWDTTGDVDLHTFEPGGNHVYYRNFGGTNGELDVDNREGYGPEHYYAYCQSDLIDEGVYEIGINNFRDAFGATATVQISTQGKGVILNREMGVGIERGTSGDDDPIHAAHIIVTKTGEDSFDVTAEYFDLGQ